MKALYMIGYFLGLICLGVRLVRLIDRTPPVKAFFSAITKSITPIELPVWCLRGMHGCEWLGSSLVAAMCCMMALQILQSTIFYTSHILLQYGCFLLLGTLALFTFMSAISAQRELQKLKA